LFIGHITLCHVSEYWITVCSYNVLYFRILDDNLLLGTIPKQIGMLKSLTVLDLSVNRFSGPIPPEIGNLTRIKKM